MSEETRMIMEELRQMNKTMSEMKSDISELKSDVSELKDLYLLIENDISKKINIIGEGHFFVMKNLKELRGFQEEKERMELKILDLQIELKRIKRHLKIA